MSSGKWIGITEPDVHRLLALEPSPRNQVLQRLLYVAGLRVSEIAGLNWQQQDTHGVAAQCGLARAAPLPPAPLRCGHEPEIGDAMRPVEAWSEQSAQLFESVWTVEACAKLAQRYIASLKRDPHPAP